MHLNCALVSSLLFVSAVLAEDSVMGGIMFRVQPWSRVFVTRVEGVFVVPQDIQGAGSGFNIGIGLDGFTCSASVLAGLTTYVTETGPMFKLWVEYPPTIHWRRDGFNIEPGDEIYVKIEFVRVEERIRYKFQNLTHFKEWVGVFSEGASNLCGRYAYWAVGLTPTGADTFLHFTDFGPVLFKDMKYGRGALPRFIYNTDTTTMDVELDGQRMTSVVPTKLSGKHIVEVTISRVR